MHVWMPSNKVWVLARGTKDANTADCSLKRGRERFEQPTVSSGAHSDASCGAGSEHARNAAAKRQRPQPLPPEANAEHVQQPDCSAAASHSPLPGFPAPAGLPPRTPEAAVTDGDRARHATASGLGSTRAGQADSSHDTEAATRPPASSESRALRVAVAAGEREGERYAGFELVEELTQEQVAEAAEEACEPLPTCPICALLSGPLHLYCLPANVYCSLRGGLQRRALDCRSRRCCDAASICLRRAKQYAQSCYQNA